MEKKIYRGLVALLLLAMAIFGSVVWSQGTHEVWRVGRYSALVFVGLMFASIPFTMLVVALLRLVLGASRGRAFWIKHPAHTARRESAEAPVEIVDRARERLAELGFAVNADEIDGTQHRLLFSKPKAPKVERFTDHALSGEISVRRENGRTFATVTTIFQDTIVVDTGEFERLDKLAGYLMGTSDGLDVPILPFTMVCGVMLAATNLALWPLPPVRVWLVAQQYSIVLGAAGLILVGGSAIARQRRQNHGVLLGALGLIAAVAPLVAG